MNIDLNMLTPIIVALVGAGGLWQFLATRSKHAHERAMHAQEERGEFSDTLREQVERLSNKLDAVIADKEQLLREMSDMRAALAEANATIKHLEEMLRNRT
jgi:peptidoglycan hydrolase CwlO-like protein